MWIFLWIVISFFILGVFFWSARILLQQKKVWKDFAKKMNLTYQEPKGFLVSPIVNGMIGPYGFALFSEEQQTEDSRGVRFSTVIEFSLRQGIPSPGAIGTPKMSIIFNTFEAPQTISLNDPDWDNSWFIRAGNAAVVQKYLTPQRTDILKKIFRMKILGALLLFNQDDVILRLETADPLNNLERVEKVIKGVIAQLSSLTLTDEERAALVAIASPSP